MFEKDLNIGYLLDFYGDLLSERKRSVMDMYYNEDLSLAEIAADIGCELPSLFRMFKKMTGMTPGEYARSLGTPSRHGPDPDPVPRP